MVKINGLLHKQSEPENIQSENAYNNGSDLKINTTTQCMTKPELLLHLSKQVQTYKAYYLHYVDRAHNVNTVND